MKRRDHSFPSHDSRAFIEVVLDNKSNPLYDALKAGSIDGTDTLPHDRAVARALHSPYDATKDGKIRGDKYKSLFVARLNLDTTEIQIRHYFERWGPLENVRLVRDIVTGSSKGYAFVSFVHESDFRRAWKEAHRSQLDGATLLVEYERERVSAGWTPRRFGGGIGGRKESGQLRFGGRDRPFKRPLATSSRDPVLSAPDPDPETLSKMGVIVHVATGEGNEGTVLHMKAAGKSTFVSQL
eukprot:TRINITY_DN1262_c0_g1_i3.p1 TRINITY_DN1262_c0_g1~~TRINITY_DN1262_c0_g1_i3.p1  ORF type:complete len:240 (-),score=29.15 TRINITY_DN1262_c0_g1_i3:34-753(-)